MQQVFAQRACGILYRFFKQHEPGKWLLPANVCPVVPLTLILAKATFEFIDINKNTLCLDEGVCLEKLSNNDYAGVIFVHTYGTTYNPQNFFAEIKKLTSTHRDVLIVDDKCLCRPDISSPQTLADLTLFSTGYAKYVDLGYGAFAFLKNGFPLSCEELIYDGTDIDALYKKAFRNEELMQDVSANWLDASLMTVQHEEYVEKIQAELGKIDEHKKAINRIYDSILGKGTSLGDDFNSWRYNILVEEKDYILQSLFGAGFFASSHYQPSSRLFTSQPYPNADWLFCHIINLFNDKYITTNQALESAQLIRNISKQI